MARGVELARRLLVAFNGLDADEACAVTDPDVEFTVIAEQVTGTLPDGHDGLRQWFAATSRTWEELRAEESEWTVEERGEWVIASGHTVGVARDTGREMEFPWTAVSRAADGRIVEFGVYLSRDDALRAIAPE